MGTDLVQYGYIMGTDLVQYGYSMGTGTVWVHYGYRPGTVWVQTWYGYMFCTCTELKYGYKNKTKFITPRPGEGLVY